MGFSTDEELLNSINLESITQYRDFINQLRPILMGDSGFQEVTTDIPLQEGLKNALPSQQNQHRRLTASVSELQGEIARREAAGITTGMFGTTEGRELGHGIGRFSTTELKNILQRNSTELETLTGKLTKSTKLEQTAEAKALAERFKALEASQLELSEKQLQRQKDALEGKIETSPILAKAIQDQFNVFKENQARAGNIIMGDDAFTAVAKGSAAQESLRAFQDNAKAEKQREIQGIVQGETPLTYAGLELASGMTGRRAYAQPGAPNYGSLSSMSLAGAQPFQFDRQMNMQQQMLNASKSRSKSSGGMGTALGGLAGLGLSAAMPGPWSPAMGQVGMGAGALFGGMF